jgi:alanine racemase
MEMNNQGFDMARCGIVTYGLYPSDEVDSSRLKLKPAMEWSSRVIHVKDVKAGTGIGYGWSYTAPEDMRVATVSAGYADGYPRAQSNRGRVIINGKYAPIIGRVCMDQFMVDVTHIENVCCRDKVILVGQSGNCRITMEEVAEPAASFNYELVCNVGRRVPRIYIRDGKVVSVMNYLLR